MEVNSDSENNSDTSAKIGTIEIRLWPDKTRITLKVNLLDLINPLSLSLAIQDNLETVMVETSIIETVDSEFELTMHLPGKKAEGLLKIVAILFDQDDAKIDQKTIPFTV
ncbi:MAG: hypothetical protein BGO78_00490 [Chloroflexi bacterium 44-23]|nr:MAG: hypothetical protein BGO78_00490 [Chloroflexi bacterium 44-23]